MNQEVTLENIAHLIDKKLDVSMENIGKLIDEKVNNKIDTLTELMLERFDDVYYRLDKIEFNTSGQERRISTLEDKVRIISTKIGLGPQTQ